MFLAGSFVGQKYIGGIDFSVQDSKVQSAHQAGFSCRGSGEESDFKLIQIVGSSLQW